MAGSFATAARFWCGGYGGDKATSPGGEQAEAKGQTEPPRSKKFWLTHEGNTKVDPEGGVRGDYRGQMCPTGLALDHPAANVLLDYAKGVCPVNSGQPWTLEMMEAAIDKGPHSSALNPEASQQLQAEVAAKL